MVYVVLRTFQSVTAGLTPRPIVKCLQSCSTTFVCDYHIRRDIDATRSKFLSKNKCNYLQHHSLRNYKFSMSNKTI